MIEVEEIIVDRNGGDQVAALSKPLEAQKQSEKTEPVGQIQNCYFRGDIIKYPQQPNQEAQANPEGQFEANKSKRPFHKKLREY